MICAPIVEASIAVERRLLTIPTSIGGDKARPLLLVQSPAGQVAADSFIGDQAASVDADLQRQCAAKDQT